MGSLIYEAALQRKNDGNKYFDKQKMGLATRKYIKALDIVRRNGSSSLSDSQKDKLKKDVALPCYLNLIACHVKSKDYKRAIELCNKVLEIDPQNCKALWRRGCAYTEEGKFIEAEKDLEKSLECANTTQEKKTVTTSMNKLKKLINEQDKKDKEKFKALFIDHTKFYNDLLKEIQSTIDKESDILANLSNVTSILHEQLNKFKQNKINWTGFYFLHPNGELVLGPFQGKVGCTRISRGSGVCGTAVQKKQTVVVPDVHKFEGHIACDSDSQSEIVLPILSRGNLVGVLDIDSVVLEAFDERDKIGLEQIVDLLGKSLKWVQLLKLTNRVQIKRSSFMSYFKIFSGIIIATISGAIFTFYFLRSRPGYIIPIKAAIEKSPSIKTIKLL